MSKPVVTKPSLSGAKSSAVACDTRLRPPATRTVPSLRRVAVAPNPVESAPTTEKVPVAGLNSSAVLSVPVTRTVPSTSNVAVCPERPSLMLPVGLNVPVAGS